MVIAIVMVAVDIEERRGRERPEEKQVFGAKIPTGEDQVYPFEFARLIIIPERPAFLIGNRENIHRCPPIFWLDGRFFPITP